MSKFSTLFVSAFVLLCVISFESKAAYVDYDPIVTEKVFFDVTIGGQKPGSGRIVFGLFGDIAPKTVKNFRVLAEGTFKDENGRVLTYKGSRIHRVIRGFVAQGGDFDTGNGYGGRSIYGRHFNDENFKLKHYGDGWLAMANAGPDTNGAQYAIMMAVTPWLDGHHVVFGAVVEGMSVLRAIEAAKTGSHDRPVEDIIVVDCGSLPVNQTFTIPRRAVPGNV